MKKVEVKSYNQAVTAMLRFRGDVLIVMEDRLLFQEKELMLRNVLCATTEDDLVYVVADDKVRVLRDFQEVDSFDVERMVVAVIRVLDGVIHLCGRVRQYQNHYNEIRIIYPDRRVNRTLYKPAQLAFEVVGDRLVTAKDMATLQTWVVL